MGIVLAKDWPIGEPPGIKIVNDDTGKIPDGRPNNCIMSTSYLDGAFLDSTDPQQVPCSGPFQSHKRFKVAMLPTTVDGGAGAEDGIDLVFDVDPEAGTRDYQVFQKINNWTNGRLDGFKIEVGTGIGADFVPASDLDTGAGLENLSLSVPDDFFDSNQLATFSQGLFGPIDTQHDRPAGFFDQNIRAGFNINEAGILSGLTDTLTSGDPLPSDYGDLFGPWLPNNMLPTGIFWDDDGNPDTDAQLVAWYGSTDEQPDLTWRQGAADGFAAIDDATIVEWGQNLEYTSGVIDDLVNVGLNYIVTVGDTTSFTVRVTPSVDESGTEDPAFVGAPVTPPLVFGSSDGVVSISPEPTFPVGAVVTARVGDADLNLDSEAIDEVDVSITVDGGEPAVLTLVELGPDRGVFAAILPASSSSDLLAGSVVTATYVDATDGLGGTDVVKSASTTADDGEPPTASTFFDFDGDGKADVAVYRDGAWYVISSDTVSCLARVGVRRRMCRCRQIMTVTARRTFAVYRDGAWYVISSETGAMSGTGWGTSTDVPVPADYDGDGKTDFAVYRDGAWYVISSETGAMSGTGWGTSTDVPVPADYDGDGKTDFAVYRDGIWYVISSETGAMSGTYLGSATDVPVPADYDGDGKTDFAVYRDGIWYVISSETGAMSGTYLGGSATDLPVPADYDGDGKTDIAVYRDGAWYVLSSVTGELSGTYLGGSATDVPVPAT